MGHVTDPNSKAWADRMYRHRHNGLQGTTAYARRLLETMPDESMSTIARHHHRRAIQALKLLAAELYDYRLEPNGLVTKVKHYPRKVTDGAD